MKLLHTLHTHFMFHHFDHQHDSIHNQNIYIYDFVMLCQSRCDYCVYCWLTNTSLVFVLYYSGKCENDATQISTKNYLLISSYEFYTTIAQHLKARRKVHLTINYIAFYKPGSPKTLFIDYETMNALHYFVVIFIKWGFVVYSFYKI